MTYDIEKSDTPKPAKNSVVENVAVKGNTATKKKEPHYFTVDQLLYSNANIISLRWAKEITIKLSEK